MKKATIILALNLFCILGFSQDFLGIKVGGGRQETVNKFLAKGFKVSITPSNTVTSMKGMVGNTETEVLIVCTPTTKKVWKYIVYLPKQTTWYSLKSNYNTYLSVLTDKYGEPASSYNHFIDPYFEGDGYEMSAVALEKCSFCAFWDGVYIQISEYKQVSITYENEILSQLNKNEYNAINTAIY